MSNEERPQSLETEFGYSEVPFSLSILERLSHDPSGGKIKSREGLAGACLSSDIWMIMFVLLSCCENPHRCYSPATLIQTVVTSRLFFSFVFFIYGLAIISLCLAVKPFIIFVMHKILILSENLTICPDTANVFNLTVFWHQRDNKTDRHTVIVFPFRCLMLFAMQPEKMCPSEGTLRNLGLIF